MGRPSHNRKEYEGLAALVSNGASLKDFADIFGVTRQCASKLILNRRLNAAWEKGKAERRAREKEDKEIMREMYAHMILEMKIKIERDMKKEPFASRKAFEYMGSHDVHKDGEVDYDSLNRLFTKYEEFSSKGIKISLEGLSKHCGIAPATVSRVLKHSGLRTLSHSYSKTRTLLNEEQERLVERSKETSMPLNDLGRFTGIGQHSFRRRIGKKDSIKYPRPTGNFYSAFEVYEAAHLGFGIEEICGLLDARKEEVIFSLKNEREITNIVKRDLKKVYGEKIPERYSFMFNQTFQ